MNRITNAHLTGKVNTVNHLLGFEDAGYSTIGAVDLYSAYGSTGVVRYANEFGGVSTLFNLATKRECAVFLDGMIQSLRITNEIGN